MRKCGNVTVSFVFPSLQWGGNIRSASIWQWALLAIVISQTFYWIIARAERDGIRAETRFRLSPKRTSPFKSVGASVQSTAGSRGVRISFSNAGYTTFGDGVRVLATHSIRQFPLHFPSRASPCATRFRTSSTTCCYPTNSLHALWRRPCWGIWKFFFTGARTRPLRPCLLLSDGIEFWYHL